MPRFSDVLAALAGSEALPDDYPDQLSSAYNDDIAEAIDSATARIDELTASNTTINDELAAKAAELTQAKAANWDLSQLVPKPDDKTPDETVSNDEPQGIDALFGDPDEEIN